MDPEYQTSETSSEIAATWNRGQENLLAAIADRANCNRWMHSKCHILFDKYNFYLTLPSIAVSGLVGSATIGLPSFFPDNGQQRWATTTLGVLGIGVGILTSINQYMKCAQLAEAHRAASVAYGKLHREVQSELALRRDQRLNSLYFLKLIRAEQDRLQETSPTIVDSVIFQFRTEFKNNVELEKPEIAGDLDHVQINESVKPGAQIHISETNKQSPQPFSSENELSLRYPLSRKPTELNESSTTKFMLQRIEIKQDTEMSPLSSIQLGSRKGSLVIQEV